MNNRLKVISDSNCVLISVLLLTTVEKYKEIKNCYSALCIDPSSFFSELQM